jgi:hypothetical protein
MNVIMVIAPYRYEGLWVFDDAMVGLVREPFIAGADAIIDKALENKGIQNGEQGFRLIFSAHPFPGYDFEFEWRRGGDGGNWYYAQDFEMEGWLCPALFKYFETAPQHIYARFEERSKKS